MSNGNSKIGSAAVSMGASQGAQIGGLALGKHILDQRTGKKIAEESRFNSFIDAKTSQMMDRSEKFLNTISQDLQRDFESPNLEAMNKILNEELMRDPSKAVHLEGFIAIMMRRVFDKLKAVSIYASAAEMTHETQNAMTAFSTEMKTASARYISALKRLDAQRIKAIAQIISGAVGILSNAYALYGMRPKQKEKPKKAKEGQKVETKPSDVKNKVENNNQNSNAKIGSANKMTSQQQTQKTSSSDVNQINQSDKQDIDLNKKQKEKDNLDSDIANERENIEIKKKITASAHMDKAKLGPKISSDKMEQKFGSENTISSASAHNKRENIEIKKKIIASAHMDKSKLGPKISSDKMEQKFGSENTISSQQKKSTPEAITITKEPEKLKDDQIQIEKTSTDKVEKQNGTGITKNEKEQSDQVNNQKQEDNKLEIKRDSQTDPNKDQKKAKDAQDKVEWEEPSELEMQRMRHVQQIIGETRVMEGIASLMAANYEEESAEWERLESELKTHGDVFQKLQQQSKEMERKLGQGADQAAQAMMDFLKKFLESLTLFYSKVN